MAESKCPGCGRSLAGDRWRYCPGCGAEVQRGAPAKRRRPYEVPDPREPRDYDEHVRERWFAENRTGRKCTAVIDEPKGCLCCVFHGTRWSSPAWAKPSGDCGYHNEPGTTGVFCTLAKNRIVTVIDWDDREFSPGWCPLVPEGEPC